MNRKLGVGLLTPPLDRPKVSQHHRPLLSPHEPRANFFRPFFLPLFPAPRPLLSPHEPRADFLRPLFPGYGRPRCGTNARVGHASGVDLPGITGQDAAEHTAIPSCRISSQRTTASTLLSY